MVQLGSLVPTRNSSTYLGVAKLRCRRTAVSRTALITDLKLIFSFLKSCASFKFFIFIAFLSPLLLFLSKLPPSIKEINLQQKPTNFAQRNGKSRTMPVKEIVF